MRYQNRFTRLAALAAVALAFSTAPAFAAKGTWSLGGNFGVGTYSNSDFNDEIAASGFKAVKDGYEFGGTLRHGMSDKMSLELEGMAINGKSTTSSGGSDVNVHTKGLATPVNLLIGLSTNDKYDFHAILGAGPMWNAKFTADDGTTSTESGSKTTFMGQGGFEGDYHMSNQFALTGRAMGRYAKANDVNISDNPADGQINLDMSGFAFNLGFRMFFGGGQ